MSNLFNGYGIEVTLPTQDSFLKVKETLTRIGVASKRDSTLYQSCHILHKQGKYAILHFKELFGLDGKPNNFSEEDKARRNTIANLLDEWELVSVLDKEQSKTPVVPVSSIKILSYKEKNDWKLASKYAIGKRKS